jgi:hypothetical protein
MNQTQRLERPGAHESAVTGNHIYEKTSHRDSDDSRRRRAGKFAGLAAPALTRKAWSEDRGRAPNAKQGDIVRKQGAEIAIGDLRDRASLDAARKDVDAVFYIEPAFLANEAEIGKSMVDGAKRAGMRRRAILPLMKGRGWGRIAGE